MIPYAPPTYGSTMIDTQRVVREQYAVRSEFWHGQQLPHLEAIPVTFWQREADFRKLNEAAVKMVTPGWDGYGAPSPNTQSTRATLAVLAELRRHNLLAYSVLPSADGGLGITFRGKGGRRATIELLNDGSAHYMLHGKGQAFESYEIDLRHGFALSFKHIEEYL